MKSSAKRTLAEYLGVNQQRASEIKIMIIEKILANNTLKEIVDEAIKYDNSEQLYAMFVAGKIVGYCSAFQRIGMPKTIKAILKHALRILKRRRKHENNRK